MSDCREKMECLLTSGPGDIRFASIEKPTPEFGEVLVRVKACAICGSDMNRYRSGEQQTESVVPGHEFSGVIEALGEGVHGWKKGDRVSIFPNISCGVCPDCLTGRANICMHKHSLGINSPRNGLINGGMAEFCCVPEAALLRLPAELSFQEGAIIEPTAVAWHAAGMAESVKGQNIVLYGTGAVGLLLLEILKSAGAGEIFAVDLADEHLQTALKRGAAGAWKPEGNYIQEIRSHTACGIDLIFDSVCNEASLNAGLQLGRGGSSTIMLGISHRPAALDPFQLVFHEHRLIGSFIYFKEEMETVIEEIRAGRLSVEQIITDRRPLSAGSELFAELAEHPGKHNKVILEPEGRGTCI